LRMFECLNVYLLDKPVATGTNHHSELCTTMQQAHENARTLNGSELCQVYYRRQVGQFNEAGKGGIGRRKEKVGIDCQLRNPGGNFGEE